MSDVTSHFDALARSGAWVDLYDGTETAANVSFRVRLARALALLPADARRIVDVGCGPAPLASAVTSRGATYVGLDAVPSMLAQARVREPGARLVRGGIPLPFRNAAADAVVALGFLEYLDGADAGMRELARVVRRGGIVVVSVPKPLHVDTIMVGLLTPARLLARLVWGRRSDRIRRIRLSAGHLDSLAVAAGLTPDGGSHYHFTPLPYPLTALAPRLSLRATRAAETSPRWRQATFLAHGYLGRYRRD